MDLDEFKKAMNMQRISKFNRLADTYNILEEVNDSPRDYNKIVLWETLGIIETIDGIIEVYLRDEKIHQGYLEEKIERIERLLKQLKNIGYEEEK